MCNLTLNQPIASQITGSTAGKVTVSGSVLDCPPNPFNPQRPDEVWVDVTASVLVNGQPDPTQTATVTAILPAVPAGISQNWSIELKGLSAVICGSTIRIRAACHTNPLCFLEQDFIINCGCPSATLNVEVSPSCNADGTRTSTFFVGLTNLPSGSPIFGTLHLGSGVAGSATIPVQFDPSAPGPEWNVQAGGIIGQFSFDYQPGVYNNVAFEMTFPSACHVTVPLSGGGLNIGVCTSTSCPTALTLAVNSAANPNEPLATGPGATCLLAGDYIVNVIQPDPIGRAFTWSLDRLDGNGSQLDNGPNVNGLNRNSYRLTIAAGSTAQVSVVVETPNCAEPVSGAVVLRACGRPTSGDDEGTGTGTGTGMPLLCEIARIAGLAFFIVGCVLIFAGACTSNPVLAGIGLALAVIGMVILGLWAAFCAPLNGGCLMLQRLIEFLEIVVFVLPMIAAALTLLGILPCALGLITDWGLAGSLLAILNRIFRTVGCRFA